MLSRQVKYFGGLNESMIERGGKANIVFHHLPKTAGSSFTQLLRTLFPPDLVAHASTDDEIQALARSGDIAKFRLFTGHFTYEGMNSCFPDATRLTFLRDPIERCISQYYNWHDDNRITKSWLERVDQNSESSKAIQIAQGMSLEEFIASDNEYISDSGQNLMTRYLAGKCDWQKTPEYYDPVLMAEAKYNLEHCFDFCGITEQFEQSKLLLATVVGVRPWENADALNTNINPAKASKSSKYDITAEQRALLESFNRMDMELYAFGLELFNKRLQAVFKSALDNLYQLRLQHLPMEDEPGAWVEIDVSGGYGLRGFHYAESTQRSDLETINFRWTGLDVHATIEIPLPPRPRRAIQVEVDIVAAAAPASMEGAWMTLNGRPPVRMEKNTNQSVVTLRAHFDSVVGAQPISLHTLTLGSPLVSEAAPNPRMLGLSISKVRAYV